MGGCGKGGVASSVLNWLRASRGERCGFSWWKCIKSRITVIGSES